MSGELVVKDHDTEVALPSEKVMDTLVTMGDLSVLSPSERIGYYLALCKSLSFNPLTRPFEFIWLPDPDDKKKKRLTLYAGKNCGEQLRNRDGVSIDITSREFDHTAGVYIVTARAILPSGRFDSATGVVQIMKAEWKTGTDGQSYRTGNLVPLTGDELANALMKAETKAKRRVTLSICGLGMMDDTEVDSVRGGQRVTYAEATAEALEEPCSSTTRKRLGATMQKLGWESGIQRRWIAQELKLSKDQAEMTVMPITEPQARALLDKLADIEKRKKATEQSEKTEDTTPTSDTTDSTEPEPTSD